MRTVGLIAIFAGYLIYPNAAPASTTLSKATPAQTLAIIQAALDSRDTELQNSRYTFSAVESGGNPAGPRVSVSSSEVLVRIARPRLWTHFRETWLTAPVVNDEYDSWDGLSCLTINNPGDRGEFRATVDDEISNGFTSDGINYFVGVLPFAKAGTPGFLPASVAYMTVPQWVANSAAGKVNFDVRYDSTGPRPLVVLLTREGKTRQFGLSLDPQRGMLPVRIEIRRQNGPNTVTESFELLDAIKTGDIWVPKRVSRQTVATSNPNDVNKKEYVFDTFELGGVREEETEVKFIPGTRVVDNVQNIAYDVKSGGYVEMLPLVDGNTGGEHAPGDPALVDRSLIATQSSEFTAHQMTSAPTPPNVNPIPAGPISDDGESWISLEHIVAFGAVILVICVAACALLFWSAKHSRRRRTP